MKKQLFWHQGLLLQPHHFQREDLWIQSLFEPYQRFIQPYLWGAGDLVLPKVISGTTFERPEKGEFLFPDMSWAVIGENALIESRSFDDTWIEEDRPMTVYVGLKKWNESGENVTVLPKIKNLFDLTTRYVTTADPDEVKDIYQDGPSGKVRQIYYVLKIFWEKEAENLGDYYLIPIAKLEKQAEKVVLSEKFIPPCLTINSSESLMKIVREIRDQVSSRGFQLESYKQDRGIHNAEFGTRDTVYLLALRSINRYVPMLFHLTESKTGHPWTVYGIFRQLIGELSSFSVRVNAQGETDDDNLTLLKYDHRTLWDCFLSANLIVTRLLDEITAGPDYMIRLEYDGDYYSTELQPAMFETGNRYYLVLYTEVDPQSILKSINLIAKLGCRENLPILIARALPGIGLENLPVPPQELPRRANSIYFRINHHSDHWAQIEQNNNVCLYWETAPSDLKVELMIVGKN